MQRRRACQNRASKHCNLCLSTSALKPPPPRVDSLQAAQPVAQRSLTVWDKTAVGIRPSVQLLSCSTAGQLCAAPAAAAFRISDRAGGSHAPAECMALHSHTRCLTAACLLLRHRRPIIGLAARAGPPAGTQCRVATAPRCFASCCRAAHVAATRHPGLATAAARPDLRARDSSVVAAAGATCSTEQPAAPQDSPQTAAANIAAAAAAAKAVADAAARGAYSPEESRGAHLAAIDNIRQKAFAIPKGGIPAGWADLEPLPPNTKPPPGEENAQARRALWRVLNHKEPFACPACRQPIYKLDVLGRHLLGCCPDLMSQQASHILAL